MTDTSPPPQFGLSFVGLSWHLSLERVDPVAGEQVARLPECPEPRTLALCGTRPVRRLALTMASLGPVPTVEEVRAMVAEQYGLASLRGAETKRRRRQWRDAA